MLRPVSFNFHLKLCRFLACRNTLNPYLSILGAKNNLQQVKSVCRYSSEIINYISYLKILTPLTITHNVRLNSPGIQQQTDLINNFQSTFLFYFSENSSKQTDEELLGQVEMFNSAHMEFSHSLAIGIICVSTVINIVTSHICLI